MVLTKNLTNQFNEVKKHVNHTADSIACSGGACMVILNDQVVFEDYFGRQSLANQARKVQADTQFHVASVRKSYIGFAAAYAVYTGCISSIDDPVARYLPLLASELAAGVTIRHLLTHTHGLTKKDNSLIREFPPGTNWAYRAIGIEWLTQIIKDTTGKTVAELLQTLIFEPLAFKETGWYATKHKQLVEVILQNPNDPSWYTSNSIDGDKMNMYVSARELALFGYFHLKQGVINGRRIVPKEVIELAVSVQSPNFEDSNTPQNGFLWFVKEHSALKTEIGSQVPAGSYQILGYTNTALLVVPEHNLVAVRMLNSFGSPPEYDYLQDIRSFGDTIIRCL